MIAVLIFFTVIICDGYETPLYTKFKMMRGRLNNYTFEDIPREDALEYPRKNVRLLKAVNELWNKYYSCLLKKKNKERKPEIRRLLEGQFTEFQCDICSRPFQDYDELEWRYKPLTPDVEISELQYLDLTPEMIFTENKTLQIYNAVENVAGLYVCGHKTNIASVYILEVSKNDTMERVETSRIKLGPSINVGDKEYMVKYEWTQWTECSACGNVGRRFKYATCFIFRKHETSQSQTMIYKRKRAQRDIFEAVKRIRTSNASTILNLKENTLQNWGPEIIEKFSTGIPCASPYLPKSGFEQLQQLMAVKVLVKYCWERCKEIEIFEVYDNSGKLIEWANNTAGIYSAFQKLPHMPHDIERTTMDADFGSDIIIRCPGTSFTNTPVAWKVRNKVIFPEVIANESNGRFTIDLVNRINLKKLRLKDSNIYSCWHKEKLVGTVHLNVEKRFKIKFDHHVTLFGVAAIVGTFLLVGGKVLARELNMRKK